MQVTLSRRFSAAFVVIVVLPSVVILVVLARSYQGALYATIARQDAATTAQVVHNIGAETDAVSLFAAALVHDRELGALADAYAAADDQAAQFRAGRALDDKLVSFFSFSNRLGAVVLRLTGGRGYRYANYTGGPSPADVDRSVVAEAIAAPGQIAVLDTLDGLAGTPDAGHWIAIAVAPASDEPSALEALVLVVRVPYFDALAAGQGKGGGPDSGPDVMMLGRAGQPLLSSVRGPAAAALAARVRGARTACGDEDPAACQVHAAGRRWLATIRPVASTGWTVAVLSDAVALTRRATRYQWYLYPALALLALAFLAYARLFVARVAAPIRAMIGHMARLGSGDLGVRAAPQPIRELAELTRGFNHMVDESRRLAAERDLSERERLSAELDALRYRIDPHFVVNTLSSIRLMASAARADAIATMTRDLMRVLADSYSSAGVLNELSRELATVTAYVDLMKVRFGERFELELAVDPDVGSALVLRMILQPIVENSILHGFADAQVGRGARRGTIRITARWEARDVPVAAAPEPWAVPVAGRALVIEVRDNGAGMTADRAAEVVACRATRGGLSRIGVANVQRRIRLHFGDRFGLAIDSERGAFTRVQLVLPVLLRAPAESSHA